MPFGRTYEEFEVGAVYQHWPIVEVETRGYNQDGTLVCVFRRKVMVPTRTYVKEHGGDQPARPEPAAPSPPRPEPAS